jgi:DNA-binding NtrC family response regulator
MAACGSYPRTATVLRAAMDAAVRREITLALARYAGSMSEAARYLGVTRPGLYGMMARLGMSKDTNI